MTLPVYPSSLSFNQIYTEHGGYSPINLSQYYTNAGYIDSTVTGYPPPPAPPVAKPSTTAVAIPSNPGKVPPTANLADPRSGSWGQNPISVGNFLGSKFHRSYTVVSDYLPTFYIATSYSQTGFGHGTTWANWLFDKSDAYISFTTSAYPAFPAGKTWSLTLNVLAGQYQVYVGAWTYYDRYTNWTRYDHFSGGGVALCKSDGTLIATSSVAGSGDTRYNGTWQVVPTAALTATLQPNTTYQLRYSGYWYREDYNNYDSKGQCGAAAYSQPYFYITLTGT